VKVCCQRISGLASFTGKDKSFFAACFYKELKALLMNVSSHPHNHPFSTKEIDGTQVGKKVSTNPT
jgi:hypothetical protein